MTLSVLHTRQALSVQHKEPHSYIDSTMQRKVVEEIETPLSAWREQSAHQHLFLSREEAIRFKATLIPEAPLYSQISRALHFGSGIHTLSNGIKIYAIPAHERLLGGGFQPNLVLFSKILILTTQLQADLTNTSIVRKIGGELQEAIKYLSGMACMLDKQWSKCKEELSETNKQRIDENKQLDLIQEEIDKTTLEKAVYVDVIRTCKEEIEDLKHKIDCAEYNLQFCSIKLKKTYFIPGFGQVQFLLDGAIAAKARIEGEPATLKKWLEEWKPELQTWLTNLPYVEKTVADLSTKLTKLNDQKRALENNQTKLEARSLEIRKLHTSVLHLMVAMKRVSLDAKFLKEDNNGNLILAENSELEANMVRDFNNRSKEIEADYKRIASTNEVRTICSGSAVQSYAS